MLILPNVNPPTVPNELLVKRFTECEVSVVVPAWLSENVKSCEPLTLNTEAFPLFNIPNPNNCASTADCSDVVPLATDVYEIPYVLLL